MTRRQHICPKTEYDLMRLEKSRKTTYEEPTDLLFTKFKITDLVDLRTIQIIYNIKHQLLPERTHKLFKLRES